MKTCVRRFTAVSRDQVRKLPPSAKAAIRLLTDALLDQPEIGKALQEDLTGYRSVRHNRYRVIYEYVPSRGEIVIHYIGLRADVYRDFARLRKTLAGKQ